MHQETIIGMAGEVLGSDRLGGRWFELGGSSMDAARLVSRVLIELGVELSVVDLLSTPDVSAYLGALDPAPEASPKVEEVKTLDSGAASPSGEAPAVEMAWRMLSPLSASERRELVHRLIDSL